MVSRPSSISYDPTSYYFLERRFEDWPDYLGKGPSQGDAYLTIAQINVDANFYGLVIDWRDRSTWKIRKWLKKSLVYKSGTTSMVETCIHKLCIQNLQSNIDTVTQTIRHFLHHQLFTHGNNKSNTYQTIKCTLIQFKIGLRN